MFLDECKICGCNLDKEDDELGLDISAAHKGELCSNCWFKTTYGDAYSAYYFILFLLMTVKNLLTLCPNLYPNLVALAALNILMNLRGKRIGIKAAMDTSSQ
jgi:hypothetical protein